MTEHIPTCAQSEKLPCAANHSLYGEPPTEHWWNGWPGACCQKCGAEDKDEVCLAVGCQCPCHNDFWEGYERFMQSRHN